MYLWIIWRIIQNSSQNPKGPQDPGLVKSCWLILYLVMKAYVNEVPVLQACRMQDGAKMAVGLITSHQLILCCPASTTIKEGRVSVCAPYPRTSICPPCFPSKHCQLPGQPGYSQDTIPVCTSYYGIWLLALCQSFTYSKLNEMNKDREKLKPNVYWSGTTKFLQISNSILKK